MDGAEAAISSDQVGRLLAAVFERFTATGEWPLVDELRYELDQADDDLDVMGAGQNLDAGLGRVGLSQGDRASLTINGIARCTDSAEVLSDLLRTMQLAYRTFRAEGTSATLTSDVLQEQLGFTPLQVKRVYELMWPLPGIGGGTSASPGSWQRQITADITAFRRVESIQDLVALDPSTARSQAESPSGQLSAG